MDDKKTIECWRIVMETTEGESISYEVNNDTITGAIDDMIADDYDVAW